MSEGYPVPVVGEQYYQNAVNDCRVGDIVDVMIEDGNPHDAEAIVVRSRKPGTPTLGYIARDSFVQRVIHQDGESVVAAIRGAGVGERGFRQLVLLVQIHDGPAQRVAHRPGESSPPPLAMRRPAPAPMIEADEPQPRASVGPVPIILGLVILTMLVRCMS